MDKRCISSIAYLIASVLIVFGVRTSAYAVDSPVSIAEIKVSDYGVTYDSTKEVSDWVELYNSSDEPVSLLGLYLTDNENSLSKQPIPDIRIKSRNVCIIEINEFGLDAGGETLYLTNGEEIIDSLSWSLFPYYCSIGRMPGESRISYFEVPSPGTVNSEGKHILSDSPVSLADDGVLSDSKDVKLKLKANGTIYYTTDGSLPTEESEVYSAPIDIDSTCVVRAVSVENDGIRSFPLNLSFIINENHSLPVVSLVTDYPARFERVYSDGVTQYEIPGNITLFDKETPFSVNCGVDISGWASRKEVEKKNMDVHFRSAYGCDSLGCDIFGTGFSDYSSLSLRSGQDSVFRMYNGEVWQDLCSEMTDNVFTQQSKFCILYLNGDYRGIYCLKNNISKDNIARVNEVKKSSVETCDVNVKYANHECDFEKEVFHYCLRNDMALPENFEYFCSKVDIDSYIDWLILEGVSGNTDLFSNVRVFRVNGDKWKFIFFDLDQAMRYYDAPWSSVFGLNYVTYHPNEMACAIFNSLIENQQFRELLLSRYSEVYEGVLGNKNIIRQAKQYYSLLLPEAERDRSRWKKDYNNWISVCEELETQVNELNWQEYALDKFCQYAHVTEEEKDRWF